MRARRTSPRNCSIHEVVARPSRTAGVAALSFTSSRAFPRHTHDQLGVGVVAAGLHRSWSGMGAVEAAPGDVIVVNPGEVHDGVPAGRMPRRWHMLYLDPDLIARELGDAFPDPVEIISPVARDPRLAAHVGRAFRAAVDPHGDALADEEARLRLLAHLVRHHGAKRPGPIRAAPSVARAREKLDALAPEEKVSLAELAALSGVSRFQLLRGFNRELGLSPHAYLVQCRVSLARQLLARGAAPGEAAVIAGFADQAHLTRAFAQRLGITPGRYRAAFR